MGVIETEIRVNPSSTRLFYKKLEWSSERWHRDLSFINSRSGWQLNCDPTEHMGMVFSTRLMALPVYKRRSRTVTMKTTSYRLPLELFFLSSRHNSTRRSFAIAILYGEGLGGLARSNGTLRHERRH